MKETIYNLTNPQKSILMTEQFYSGSNINNICGTAIVDNKLNFDVLKKAINIVAKNNDSFNFKLILDNNEIKQCVDRIDELDIEIVDIDSHDDISKIETDMMNHTFYIYNSRPYCFKIFRLKDNTGGFMLNIHHLYADSWTLGLTARKIVKTYSSLINNEPIEEDVENSYINYIYSEKEYLNSEKYIKDKKYWEDVFSTIPEQASIPAFKQEAADDFSPVAERKIFSMDKFKIEKINQFCKSNNISIFNFFMAIYSIYIGRVSNLDDFVIGTPILNRTNFREKNTTGMFINTAPLRIKLNNNLDFKSFVCNIAKDSLSMLRHQKYHYQNILEDLRKRDSSLPNLYNIILSYQVTKANTEKDLSYTTRWAFNGSTADDIDIHLYDLNDSGSLNIAYDYKVSKYNIGHIVNIHNRILCMIDQVLNSSTILLNDINIVTEDEKNELLFDFNNTNLKYDENKPFISYFEEQVKLHPDNIALTFHGENMTYSILNERANSLAHLLKANGVTNNSIVGILVNRSFEMIISILAVLKSGGAYIPIDPDYPDDRINYMVEDSKMSILLTRKRYRKKDTLF